MVFTLFLLSLFHFFLLLCLFTSLYFLVLTYLSSMLFLFCFCFRPQQPELCTFGLSGCRVKPRRPHQTGAAGARTRQPENSKRAHFRAPALETPPKFHERTPREKEERKLWREEGKKNAKFWVHHPSGLHPSVPLFPGLGPPPFGAPPFEGPTLCRPKIQHRKIGRNRIGRSRNWPKSKLAEVGRAPPTLPEKRSIFGTVDLPECQEPLPPPQKTVDFGTVDLPECQEPRLLLPKKRSILAPLTFPNVNNNAIKHKSTKKSVFFFSGPGEVPG